MSEANHTPGPWCVDGEDYFAKVVSKDGWTIAETSHIHDGDLGKAEDIHLANMRLIAAAPDLLAACEASLALLTKYGEGRFACAAFESERKLIHQLRAAITKAKGRPA